MLDNLAIEPMTDDFIMWRCLHGGPLSTDTIDKWPPDQTESWETHRSINTPLLRKLMATYGTCAMLARDGDQIVGSLRFYPKVLFSMEEVGEGLCLQQIFPAGPSEHLAEITLPSIDEIHDKTLMVHCLMTGSPFQKQNPYQRKGVGMRLVRELMRWAKENGWKAIEVETHEDIPFLYAHTGTAGKGFWEKLGFRVMETGIEPELQKEGEFTREVRRQAAALGFGPEAAETKYTMRIELD